MALRISVPSEFEPLTLEQAKAHCRVDFTDDDDLIRALVASARQRVESGTKRALCYRTYQQFFDGGFPAQIRLGIGPVQEVVSITYLDDDGTEQTLASSLYRVALKGDTCRIEPAFGEAWPSVYPVLEAVTVTFRAGYTVPGGSPTLPTACPEELVLAVKLILAHWYENREETIVGTSAQSIPMGAAGIIQMWARHEV